MQDMTREEVKELDPSEITADAANAVIDNDTEEDVVETVPLGWREAKALKNSKYSARQKDYKQEFVLANTKTGQIAEVKGVSSLQACGSIGWRARYVKVLEIKEVETEEQKNHTEGSSEVQEVSEVD
jgi:hypothetical protein